MIKKLRGNEKGFTLVELVIVITILSILSTMGLQSYGRSITQAKAQADIENAKTIGNALVRAMADGMINDCNVANIDDTIVPITVLTNAGVTGAIGATFTTLGTPIIAGTDYASVLVNNKYLDSIPAIKSYKTGQWYVRIQNSTGSVRVFFYGSNDGGTTNTTTLLYPKFAAKWPSAPFNLIK